MSQLYDIYKRSTFALARTLVLKFDLINQRINNELMAIGVQVDELYPETHKYYLNLSGEYHAVDKYKLKLETGKEYMTITIASSEGSEEVPFTKELFYGNRPNVTLLSEYYIGSEYYNNLLERYPEYELLIKGILHPIDLRTALNAKDGTILSLGYRKLELDENNEVLRYQIPEYMKGFSYTRYIEPNEHNIISELQTWIDKVNYRWLNAGYSLSDDLYVAFHLGVLYSNVPVKLMNIRLANVHTAMTHSFHVREYLESHGMLGKYIRAIPIEQVMYLYRNVRYLELNMGKTFVFNELIKHMLTPTGIPLAGYNFKHDLSEIDSVEVLTPDPKMYREHLNFKSIGSSTDVKTVRNILDEQIPLARENGEYLNFWEGYITDKMKYSSDDQLMTKVLESELFEVADPIPVEFYSMLMWMWIYSASTKLYIGHVYVSNPVSDDTLTLTILDALKLWLYCINRGSQRVILEHIPNGQITVMYLPRSNNPKYKPEGYPDVATLDDLKRIVDPKCITDTQIQNITNKVDVVYEASSAYEFRNNVKVLHDELIRQWFEACKIEDMYARGYADNVFRQQYWHNVPITLTNKETTYKSFITRLGLHFTDFTENDFVELASRIVYACIGGMTDEDFSRGQLQKAMIEIMKHFSSYTTHYISKTVDSAIASGNGKYPRMTNLSLEGDAGLSEGIDLNIMPFKSYAEGEGSSNLSTLGPDIVNPRMDIDEIHFGFIDHGLTILGTHGVTELAIECHNYTILDATIIGTERKKYDPLPNPPPIDTLDKYSYYASNAFPLLARAINTSVNVSTFSAVPAEDDGSDKVGVNVSTFIAVPSLIVDDSLAVTPVFRVTAPAVNTDELVSKTESGISIFRAVPPISANESDNINMTITFGAKPYIPPIVLPTDKVTVGVTFGTVPYVPENIDILHSPMASDEVTFVVQIPVVHDINEMLNSPLTVPTAEFKVLHEVVTPVTDIALHNPTTVTEASFTATTTTGHNISDFLITND